jgi:hypothetical protein
VAAVLNSRLSTSKVSELVEFLYMTEYFAVSEKMAIAQRRRDNPYPALAESIGGGPIIHCGDNPFLRAQLVDDLTVESDANGRDTTIKWRTRQGRRRSVALRRVGLQE